MFAAIRAAAMGGALLGVVSGAAAAELDMELGALPQDLTELSLEALLNVDVTSVSKRAEPLFQAAAAAFVLSGEEIRRSGVRTIPDALRLVPGMQVAHNSAQNFIVTARGFTGGDKLEVVVDGRSVYSPLTSAVFWDVLDVPLSDIERIEVIRGPGATLWGANAVNGVISIVTRHAREASGVEVIAGGGIEELGFAQVRGGWGVGAGGDVRAYVKADERDSAARPDGSAAIDGLRKYQTGFRSDWTVGKGAELMLSGDAYSAREPAATSAFNPAGQDTVVSGSNLGARWTRKRDDSSELVLQAYYDGYKRVIPGVYDERRATGDLNFQYQMPFGDSSHLMYGLGYRYSRDRTGDPPVVIIFEPAARKLETYSAFLQNQLSFAGGDATLTIGSKFEHNDFTGFEAQPGIRLGWKLGERTFTWGAISRAVRTPNRLDHDIAIFCSAAVSPLLNNCAVNTVVPIGSRNFESEQLVAYEWGLRWAMGRAFSADLATYYNDYRDLRSTEPGVVIGSFANGLEGDGRGAELGLSWLPAAPMSLRAFYSWQDLRIRNRPGSADVTTGRTHEGSQPQSIAGLQADWAPLSALRFNGFLRHVGRLPALQVPAYAELDLRAAWKPSPAFELALVGRNLLDAQHPEFGTATRAPATELERAGWVQLTWSWR